MADSKNYRFETLQLHVGQEQADPATDSRAVPIYQTTSYVFHNFDHAEARFGLADPGNIYGRLTNSTQGVFEDRIAALEGGAAGLAVASGAAAVEYAVRNITQSGDHIVAAKNVVLKGIDHGDGKIVNYVASASTGVAGKIELAHEKLPYMIHGTGDAFASALCGAVMAGRGLAESAEIAGEFVRHAMVSTRNQPHFEDRGVSFELNLGELTDLVK